MFSWPAGPFPTHDCFPQSLMYNYIIIIMFVSHTCLHCMWSSVIGKQVRSIPDRKSLQRILRRRQTLCNTTLVKDYQNEPHTQHICPSLVSHNPSHLVLHNGRVLCTDRLTVNRKIREKSNTSLALPPFLCKGVAMPD